MLGWAVLALAFTLRAVLVWRGGQLFWPDEDRFEIARKIAAALLDGRVHESVDLLFSHPDHLFFKVVALVPAAIESSAGLPGWVSGLFFAAASTWVIWLVGRVARAAGAAPLQSLVSMVLAASATSLFYYSRHLLPYDLALGLLLVSLGTGLREVTTPRNSLLTGLWAGLGYFAYNGYWSLGGLLLVAHVLLALPQPRAMATRCTYALLGVVLPVFAVTIVSRLLGHDFFALTLQFAATANQGELDHAAAFAAGYFWVTERGLALFWAAALLMALDRTGRATSIRAMLWPALTLALGTVLIVTPGWLHHFAVTARHLRVLTPFLCLTAAAALCEHPMLRARPRVFAGVLCAIVLQAAINFATPLAQIFPRDFEALAARHLEELRGKDLGPYKIINASFLHDPDWAPAGVDPGRTVLRRPHPFEFMPYLYEGYSTAIRERFLERDLSMRVIRLDAGGPPRGGYPTGMIELSLRFPDRPRGLLPEPILTTGAPGRGDTIFLRYQGLGAVVVGHDHIGGGASLAQPIDLDRSATHRVLIGMDTFFPPNTLPQPTRRFVLWNDQVLLHGVAELHPTTPGQIAIGHNFIGSSTAVTQLSAEILGFRHIPFPQLGAVFPVPPGALKLKLLLNSAQPGTFAVPLLSSGPKGRGDLVFIRRENDGRFRLGHDHWGGGAGLSEPFLVDTTRAVEFVIAMGPFLAATPTGPGDDTRPRMLFARQGDDILFNRLVPFHPTDPSELSLGENRTASTSVPSRLTTEFLSCEPAALGTLPPPPTAAGGPMRVRLRFFGEFAAGRTDPLVTTGRAGAGDLLFIQFDGAGHYQIGHDHWGYAVTLSAKHAIPADQTLDLTISLGTLDSDAAGFAQLRDRLFVATPDAVVLDRPAQFHPAGPEARSFGFNRIGASTAGEFLGADLIAQAVVPPADILARIGK